MYTRIAKKATVGMILIKSGLSPENPVQLGRVEFGYFGQH